MILSRDLLAALPDGSVVETDGIIKSCKVMGRFYRVDNGMTLASVGLQGKVLFRPDVENTKALPPVVEVVRFIRPKYINRENLYGVTFVINIDYVNKWIVFQYSTCWGDNFDKKKAIEIARSKPVHQVAFSGKISSYGVVQDILNLTQMSPLIFNKYARAILLDSIPYDFDKPDF